MAAMELGSLLQSLQALKPPGVNKPKIEAITATCVENIQSDKTIVQKIIHQFKNSPVTHKLGVLYVVDSVTRQWVERAKKSGQAVSKSAAPGTFASGVQMVTDALPNLMTELVQCAPDSQKEKISKLLDIWERGQTFPQNMLASFKQQLKNPHQSTTQAPPDNASNDASNARGPAPTNQQPVVPPAATVPQDTGALLAALANYGQKNSQTNAMSSTAQPAHPFQNMLPPPPPPGFAPLPPSAAVPAQSAMPSQTPGVSDLATQILHAMSQGSLNPEQGITILNALNAAKNAGSPLPPPQPAAVAPQPVTQQSGQQDRFDTNGSRYRDRSRSPDSNHRRRSPMRRSPPNRRDSPTYGVYEPNAGAEGNVANRNDRAERGRGRGRHRSGRNERNEYRQRTPPRRQPSPGASMYRNGSSKYLEWDNSLPRDNIKVLSRTLFVGGAGGTEDEIRAIFSRFGRVQTCIVNQEKRHAFVKMFTRPDAVSAKEGMDSAQDPSATAKARQTRWGVGFGPRDCSDYSTGISVIPISRLTDADRKWALTAENGGTGGRQLEGGMVMEEPDIEIGAGVSSKAISRRVPTDSGRGRGYGGRGGGFDRGPPNRRAERNQMPDNRHISPRPEPAVAVPPTVPSFGFQLH